MSAPRQDNAGRASDCGDNAPIILFTHWVGGLVEVTRIRSTQREQIHYFQPTKAPAGGECFAAAQGWVIFSRISHAGIEQYPERAWKGRIPGSPEQVAIRAFADSAAILRWNGSELRFDRWLHLRESLCNLTSCPYRGCALRSAIIPLEALGVPLGMKASWPYQDMMAPIAYLLRDG